MSNKFWVLIACVAITAIFIILVVTVMNTISILEIKEGVSHIDTQINQWEVVK